jgi:hypothetical protein
MFIPTIYKSNSQVAPLEDAPWHVTVRKAHENVWESVVLHTNALTGQVSQRRHSFVYSTWWTCSVLWPPDVLIHATASALV